MDSCRNPSRWKSHLWPISFKLKNDKEGNISKFKVRGVLHSYKWKEQVDYFDTFANIIQIVFCRSFFTIRVKQGLKIGYIDVVTQFWDSFLEEIFMLSNRSYFIQKTRNIRYSYFGKSCTVSNNLSVFNIGLFLNSCKRLASKYRIQSQCFFLKKHGHCHIYGQYINLQLAGWSTQKERKNSQKFILE